MNKNEREAVLGPSLEQNLQAVNKLLRLKEFINAAGSKIPTTYGPQFQDLLDLVDRAIATTQKIRESAKRIAQLDPDRNASDRGKHFRKAESVAVTRSRNRLTRIIQGEICDLGSPAEHEALLEWLLEYTREYAATIHSNEIIGMVPVAEAVCDEFSEAGGQI